MSKIINGPRFSFYFFIIFKKVIELLGFIFQIKSGNKYNLRIKEILYPVATVILGGLVTSTFCEFLIHPGLFWKFSGKDALKLARLEESEENPEHSLE